MDRAEGGSSSKLENLSDAELEAELQRRRARREGAQQAASQTSRNASNNVEEQAWQEVEDAMRGRGGAGARRGSQTHRSSGAHTRTRSSGRSADRRGADSRMAKLYAQIECPYGADIDTVRKSYRAMMRKYHPDVHSHDVDKQRVATELSQRLTAAYNELKRQLERR
ncbi:MAG: J domain-containing protein [Deltaproteobacteria bacterium]|nr:J domain-containing protein [Deltaproteobacteria bacterium]